MGKNKLNKSLHLACRKSSHGSWAVSNSSNRRHNMLTLSQPWTDDIQQHISQPTAWACEASESSGYATGDPIAFFGTWTPGGIGCDAGLGCLQTKVAQSWEQIFSLLSSLLDDLKMTVIDMIVERAWKIMKDLRSFKNRKDDMNGLCCYICIENSLNVEI